MNTQRRLIPFVQFLMLAPALVFMISLLLRLLPSVDSEPARTAIQVVRWFSGKIWTLWVLLTAMPMAALILGGTAQGIFWMEGTRFRAFEPRRMSTLILTGVAMIILVVVGLHVLMN